MFKPTFKPIAIKFTHSVITMGLHAVGFLVDCSKKPKCMGILKIPLSLYVAKKQTKKINAGP